MIAVVVVYWNHHVGEELNFEGTVGESVDEDEYVQDDDVEQDVNQHVHVVVVLVVAHEKDVDVIHEEDGNYLLQAEEVVDDYDCTQVGVVGDILAEVHIVVVAAIVCHWCCWCCYYHCYCYHFHYSWGVKRYQEDVVLHNNEECQMGASS
jgi:hypothetical protein